MDTKQRIIDISLKAFLEKGYDNFSMRNISKAVGIKQPTIYYYFEDKLALFKECIRVFFDKWYGWMAQTAPEDIDLKGLIKNTCLSFGRDNDVICSLYGADTASGQYRLMLDILAHCPQSMHYLREFNESYFALLKKLTAKAKADNQIRKSVHEESLYLLLASLIEGSNIIHITDPDLNFEQENERIFMMIWNGIKSDHEGRILT